MKTHNLAFIDLELTGLDPAKHEIIEIGFILVRQAPREGKGPLLEVLQEREWKTVPERIEDADSEALAINGYTKEAWCDAVPLGDALTELADMTPGAIMVGQNVAMDWLFLERAFHKTDVKNTMHYHRLDTMPMAFAKYYDDPALQKFSLRELCAYFGITNEKAHTALSDVRATMEVYKKIVGVE